MNEIVLPAIGVTTKTENNYLVDYGFVSSIVEKIVRIYVDSMKTYHGIEKFLNLSDLNYRTGLCLYLQEGRKKTWYIFQIHVNENVDAFTRGYLETQLLHGIGNLKDIEGKFQKLKIYSSLEKFYDFKKCSNNQRDFVATLGGLYVMLKKSLNPKNLPEHWMDDDVFRLAVKCFNIKY
ncbi:MAG: hypothetical protein ABIN05_06375 [candidate division WOR-3 bacterium]